MSGAQFPAALSAQLPEVVCRMNLTLIASALDAAGARTASAHLDPAEGRCCVTVRFAKRRSRATRLAGPRDRDINGMARLTLRVSAISRHTRSAQRCYPGISAKPWATAHGAHSGTSTSPSRPTGSLRVITARWSHTPRSLGWETVHAHSQARCGQPVMARQVSPTARTAGSVVSLWNASAVTAAVRSAHSAATAVAACQAARSCRPGLSPVVLTIASSHPGRQVTSRALDSVTAEARTMITIWASDLRFWWGERGDSNPRHPGPQVGAQANKSPDQGRSRMSGALRWLRSRHLTASDPT